MNAHLPQRSAEWTQGRLLVATVFIAAVFAALLSAAVYLSAALFLLLNKRSPAQTHFTSIVDYWQAYADIPSLRKKLQGSVALSFGGLLVALPAAVLVATRSRRSLHGDARFATGAEVERAGLTHGDGPGILLGRFNGQFLSLTGQLSVLLSAPTRSGKGVGIVIPNLLNWPDSVVVFDIKGENYEITAGYRAACGQAVFALSPFDDEGRSHRWNPLSCVRTDVYHRTGDLLSIGQVFYPSDGGSTSSEAFFNDQARNLFLGLGLLLLDTPQLPRTVGEMLRQASGQGKTLRAHLGDRIAAKSKAPPLSGECVDALQRLLSNSDNTMSSIVATFLAPLTIFADTIVDAVTSADDFHLEDLRRQRMSIYVRIPPHRLASARPLINLFFSQLVALNTQHLPEEDHSLKYQCLIANDEFAAMGRASVITGAVPYLAGYNLRLLTVIQAMSQLDAVYGDKEARTFATNHGLQILFAPREQRDAEEYSAMLGYFTEQAVSRGRSHSLAQQGHTTTSLNESAQRRALLMPQEFKEIGSERQVLILENCKPILATKIRYYKDAAFKERLLAAPAIRPLRIDIHLARVQGRVRLLDGDLLAEEGLDMEALAYDLDTLPQNLDGSAEAVAAMLFDFLAEWSASALDSQANAGGAIEPLPDAYGVLIDADECRTTSAPAHAGEPSPEKESPCLLERS